ncbi:ferritin-like domain-containing protein [Thermoleophilia bacterium SCSIO 60948]|nr:ferritin-like domain-containing protein [Thermoleophilia bacterium SCSIO 60948]
MSAEHLDLDSVDVDGAVRESAERASFELDRDGDTRADFLKKAGLAGGAAIGGGALLGGLVPSAAMGADAPPASKFGRGDVGILNYALTLEYLEAEFYKEAQRNQNNPPETIPGVPGQPFITDESTQNFLRAVVRDEKAHVAFLKKALGNKAAKKPRFDFRNTTSDEQAFQRTAFKLENTGVSAYLGQAYNIKSKSVGKAALSIATIEGRHAGLIGEILRGTPKGIAPDGPFDKPAGAKATLRAVKRTGFIQGGGGGN